MCSILKMGILYSEYSELKGDAYVTRYAIQYTALYAVGEGREVHERTA